MSALTLMLAVPISAFALCPTLWEQFAENNDSGSGTRVSASYYYTNQTSVCDNDPDTDYVFVFKGNFYNCDPDKIRYDNGAWINTSDFKIRRLATTDDDVHLCMGDNTLNLFYGGNPQNVMSGLRLYKLP